MFGDQEEISAEDYDPSIVAPTKTMTKKVSKKFFTQTPNDILEIFKCSCWCSDYKKEDFMKEHPELDGLFESFESIEDWPEDLYDEYYQRAEEEDSKVLKRFIKKYKDFNIYVFCFDDFSGDDISWLMRRGYQFRRLPYIACFSDKNKPIINIP